MLGSRRPGVDKRGPADLAGARLDLAAQAADGGLVDVAVQRRDEVPAACAQGLAEADLGHLVEWRGSPGSLDVVDRAATPFVAQGEHAQHAFEEVVAELVKSLVPVGQQLLDLRAEGGRQRFEVVAPRDVHSIEPVAHGIV